VAVFEVSERATKALVKAGVAVGSPSAKVLSEVEFFRTALATVGVDFDSLDATGVIACQDALFFAWQDSASKRAEDADAEREREANAAKARLAALEKRADRAEAREERNRREAKRIADDKAELAALRAKFSE
jgi:hypothetical protein